MISTTETAILDRLAARLTPGAVLLGTCSTVTRLTFSLCSCRAGHPAWTTSTPTAISTPKRV